MLPQQHRGSTLLLAPLLATTRISHRQAPFRHSQSCPVRIVMGPNSFLSLGRYREKPTMVMAICASCALHDPGMCDSLVIVSTASRYRLLADRQALQFPQGIF